MTTDSGGLLGSVPALSPLASPTQAVQAGLERTRQIPGNGGIDPTAEWIMMGARRPGGGVTLVASRTVIKAVLNVLMQQPPPVPPGAVQRQGPTRRIHMQAILDSDFVMLVGEGYGDLIEDLFTMWRPPGDPGTPALPG